MTTTDHTGDAARDDAPGEVRRTPFGRRAFFGAMAAGAAGAGLAVAAPAAAAFAAIPTVPGEISRVPNQRTATKGTAYDSLLVNIKGDKARIYVPQSVKPGQAAQVPVVWFYHATGSSQEALTQGFKWSAEYVVDGGAIAICQNAGGDHAFTNAAAEKAQADGWAYVSSLVSVRANYLRATSGGGALAAGVYAMKAMPRINGLYFVNALYDLEKALEGKAEPAILDAFGGDRKQVALHNPARLGASYWKRANLKVVVSDDAHPDETVPPKDHGRKLYSLVKPVGREVTLTTHTLAHGTPSWTNADGATTYARWQAAGL